MGGGQLALPLGGKASQGKEPLRTCTLATSLIRVGVPDGVGMAGPRAEVLLVSGHSAVSATGLLLYRMRMTL